MKSGQNPSIARPQTTQITSDATYNVDYAYNTIGQLDTLTYPTSTSGYRLKLQYDYQYGLLKRVKDFNAPTTVFWTANDTDPRGAVINENLGNGLQTIRGFDLVTGLVDSIRTGPGGSGSIQDLSYGWDKVGNLTQRQDVRQSLTESFNYDNLHRLTSSTGPDPITLSYDAMGNISSKTGVGSYTYHASKKHAVTAAGSLTFGYDANGNVSTRNGSSISWYSYNLPNTISASGSNSSQFFYAPDRSRWKQVASYAGTTETTIYIGGLIEKVTLGAVTSWKHYIAGGSGAVAVYTRKSGAADEMHYLTRDHLGSVDSVTNGAGAIEVRLSFGTLGQRRKEAGWSGNPTSGDWTEITDTTRRGFTFHEMLDNLNLIHMNGRVYDQVVGRFISADPYVPEPRLTQSFNRFSYTSNRPLSFTDPTGFDEAEVLPERPDDPYGTTPGPVMMGHITVGPTNYTFANSYASVQPPPLREPRNVEGGGGGGGAADGSNTREPEDKEQEEQPESPTCREGFIDLGNKVASASDDLADLSAKLIAGGLATSLFGLVTSQPEVIAIGLAVTGTGGVGGVAAGALQAGAGLLQGYGGAGYSNTFNAGATLLFGATISSFVKGPATTGHRSASQRAADALRNDTATVTGGFFDIVTSQIDRLGPQQKACPLQ